MRVAVLSGTGFVGRAVLAELVAAGHEVAVCHRGGTEPADLPPVAHLHFDRAALPAMVGELAALRLDAAVDCLAMTKADAEALVAALPADLALVVLSSMDVYRAFSSAQAGLVTDAVPLDEDSPVRADRHPYAVPPYGAAYSKLDVEDVVLPRGATVLRLPMVHGPHDPHRREEPLLRRARAGRKRIPVGTADALLPRGYVGDVGRAARLAVETGAAAGRVVNVCESRTAPMGLWLRQVLDAAGSDAELVRVPDDALPPDLRITRAFAQPVLASNARAKALLGWEDSDPAAGLRATVAWHLAHPPGGDDPGFAADDRALDAALA